MIDKSKLFEGNVAQDAEGSLHSIFNLCKIGIAANESTMAIDMRGTNESLYESIAVMAEDALERLYEEQKAAKQR